MNTLTTPPTLQLCNIDLLIGRRQLLQQVNISLTNHHCHTLIGPNGAGKTLLLKIASGLLQASAGDVRFNHPQSAATLVLQQPRLFDRSVLKNLTLPLQNLNTHEQEQRALEALSWCGCETLAQHPAQQLSTGQQQLVSLARARAMQPQVLLLDEPTANLDPATQLCVEALLQKWKQEGLTLLMSTHNLAQAQRLADQVIFIERGQIQEQTPAKRFFQQPQSQAAQQFCRQEEVKR